MKAYLAILTLIACAAAGFYAWIQLAGLEFDYTLRMASSGVCIIGIVAGGLGSFALLRKQSLLGDTIAHAALPGVVLAFMITGTKHPVTLLIGAMLAGWIGTLLIGSIIRRTHIKEDAAMGIILSVFFGLGMILLSLAQKRWPDAQQAGLHQFLFGSATEMLAEDVSVIFLFGCTALIALCLFWKEFKLLTFDPDFAKTLGFPIRRLDIMLMTLLVIAIAIGLQTVGVVLMSAMLVAPAAAARQWTNQMPVMVLLSSTFGAICGIAGTLASSQVAKLPTGPTITIFLTVVVLISLLFARERGLAWQWLKRQRNRRQIQVSTALVTLLRLEESHPEDSQHPHSLRSLQSSLHGDVPATMERLVQSGFATEQEPQKWRLTGNGKREAERTLQEIEEDLDGRLVR